MLSPNRSRRPSLRGRFKAAAPTLSASKQRMAGRLRRMTNPILVASRGVARVSGQYGMWLAAQNPSYITVVDQAKDGSWVALDLHNGATIGGSCSVGATEIGHVPGNRVLSPARYRRSGFKICRPLNLLARPTGPMRQGQARGSHAIKGAMISINPRARAGQRR